MKSFTPYLISKSILCLLFAGFTMHAQVGINTTTPAGGSLLDVDSANKGILIPRIDISNLNAIAPVTGGSTTSLLVYNTNSTTGPGYFYWNGSRWVRIDGENDWKLTGNAGTTVGTNFLGTTDGVDVVLATNGSENMRLVNGGQVTVNTTTPLFSVDRFTSVGATNESAINGYSSGSSGIGVYGENSTDSDGVVGVSSTGIGTVGVSNAVGVLAQTASNGYGVYGYASDASGYAGRFRNTDASGISMAVTGQGNPFLAYIGSSATFYGYNGLVAIGDIGQGLSASGGDLTASYIADEGVFGYGPDLGVVGYSDNSNNAGGGYFDNNASAYAYIGYRTMGTNYKVLGSGTMSTIVKDTNSKPVIMFAPEAPEVFFQDYGTGRLTNGVAYIKIDPTFANNIRVDKNHPLKVFVQLEGDCNGVFVTDKSANGFTVKELQGGNSNVPFTWTITANRADEVTTLKDGSPEISIYSTLRFPDAPPQLVKKEFKKSSAAYAEENSRLQYVQKKKGQK